MLTMLTEKSGTVEWKGQSWGVGSWQRQQLWPSLWTNSESHQLPGWLWLVPHTQPFLMKETRRCFTNNMRPKSAPRTDSLSFCASVWQLCFCVPGKVSKGKHITGHTMNNLNTLIETLCLLYPFPIWNKTWKESPLVITGGWVGQV